MKFHEIKVGQQFKFPTLNNIMTKVEVPLGFYAKNERFGFIDEKFQVWQEYGNLDYRVLQTKTLTDWLP